MTGEVVSGEHPRSGAPALAKSLHGFGALLITLSGLSPSIGVFVVASEVIRQAGSGVLICFLAAALLGVAMASVYGELASAFPQPGGEYTILAQSLGPRWGVAILALNLTGFTAAQALAGLGAATYVAEVEPGLPIPLMAAAAVAAVTLIAVLNIRLSALVTGAVLAVELCALAALTGLGLSGAHHPLTPLLLHPQIIGPGGGLKPVALAGLGAATAGAVYAFNGYGSVVFLGEELHEAPRRIARVVFLALGLAVLTEGAPLAALMSGAPDLKALIRADAPVPYLIRHLGGPLTAQVMSLGVALAIFNTMIAVALIAGRQLYCTGRDQFWGGGLNQFLARLHSRTGAPWTATLTMGAISLVFCGLDQKLLVLILGNGNVILYAGLCAAALVGRQSGRTQAAAYRLPLYPWPPVLALLALGAVGWFDLHDPAGAEGLGVSLAVAAAGLAYHRGFLQGRPRWRLGAPLQAAAAPVSPEA